MLIAEEDDNDFDSREQSNVLPSCTYGGDVTIHGRDVYGLAFYG